MKTAVVTGGSRGIGLEIAKKLIGEGYKTVICSRSERELSKSAGELGENCFAVKCDISKNKEIDNFVKRVKEKLGKVDVLVNNAGVAVWKNFIGQSYEEIELQTRINLEGLMKVSLAFLPYVRKIIINIASGAGKYPHPGLAPYCATKYGVRGFTQTLARELKNVKVFSVNPGATATKMTNYKGIPPEKVAQIVMNTINGKYKVESGEDIDVWEYNS